MKAVLDACVLFPTVMRDMLLGAAALDGFEPVWSARILEEWARATRRLPEGSEQIARAEIALMRHRWPQAEVTVDEKLAASLCLPDPDDRHVFATAITSGADTIVTLNRKDFPTRILTARGVHRRLPDDLLVELHHAGPRLSSVAEQIRAKLETSSATTTDLRAMLKKARLPRLAKALDRSARHT